MENASDRNPTKTRIFHMFSIISAKVINLSYPRQLITMRQQQLRATKRVPRLRAIYRYSNA